MPCLDENRLLTYLDAAEQASAETEGHLYACSDCRALARKAAALSADGSARGPQTAGSPSGDLEDPLAIGTQVGRYRVQRRIGKGAMGTVYAAQDDQLGRIVALKMVRDRIVDVPRPSEDLQMRLLREAQAMARLSSPNVVAVFDTGLFEDKVFLAMEYVAGPTATEWLRSGRRTWREVLDLFVEAGRGLADAHRAGLVHRDFKPDNVLVHASGRVCVTDFGLCRPLGQPEEDAAASSAAQVAGAPASLARITQTGAIVGTPAYMAPEQVAGAPACARSDQFAFCVALYEALYGERPFARQTVADLAQEMEQGACRPPPPETRVPARLRRILLHGLAVRPEERYPSMDALLLALSRFHDWRWIGRFAAGVLLAVLCIAGVHLYRFVRARADITANERIHVLSPDGSHFGRTYPDWAGRWLEWALGAPHATNPIIDPSGVHCGAGQSGPVWFLAGHNESTKLVRSCSVPREKALFFPIVMNFCSKLVDRRPDLQKCARLDQEDAPLQAEIDGVPVRGLAAYRARSPIVSIPTATFLDGAWMTEQPVDARTTAASDGYYLLLAPLHPGQHEIHFVGVDGSFSNEVTYHLRIE